MAETGRQALIEKITEIANTIAQPQGFGLQAGEEVIAFLYLGTPLNPPRTAAKVDVVDFVSEWQG